MFPLSQILCFLAGLWLGRRLARRREGCQPSHDEWRAYGQGAFHVRRDSRRVDSPGRIYLHSPPW